MTCLRRVPAVRSVLVVVIFLLAVVGVVPVSVLAECRDEPGGAAPQPGLVKHLSPDCTEQDRQARAVPAEALLRAIQEGRPIDLSGVVIVGDLDLSRVPVSSLADHPDVAATVGDAIRADDAPAIRLVRRAVTIRDSTIRGSVMTRIKDGAVVFQGPVTMAGTVFDGIVDLSRAVFTGAVEFSDAVFNREAFFIQAAFLKPARFERVAFGPHTRFHRARFHEPVTFQRSGFNGLSEFLEVGFGKEASFSRTYFKMGTGFSGGRFAGMLDFSEAVFEREAFFLFTAFEADVYFHRSTFRGQADFSDATFKGGQDFSKTYFAVIPRFERARMTGPPPRGGGLQREDIVYAISASLVIFAILFLFVLRKR
ncbi:pentapeptide repeat-containing protein [Candidatus Nitrospira bockiana]